MRLVDDLQPKLLIRTNRSRDGQLAPGPACIVGGLIGDNCWRQKEPALGMPTLFGRKRPRGTGV